MSLFISCICRRYNEKNDFEYDPEDDGTSLNNIENIKKFETLCDTNPKKETQTKYRLVQKTNTNESQLKEALKKRAKDFLIGQILKELLFHCIFLCLLYFIAYGEFNKSSFNNKTNLNTMFNVASVRKTQTP